MAMRMAKRQQAGSEFIPLALSPLYLLAPVASVAGAIAGFWLATRAHGTAGSVILYVAGGVLAACAAPSVAFVMMAWAAHRLVSPRRRVTSADESDASAEGAFRWITADEAVNLLDHGTIKTFSYGVSRFPENRTASGQPTGILLTDYGWVRHIYVESSMEDTMVPVARAAQRSHDGVPQFCVDGIYEPVPDPE
jgi:hypothetical protein